MLVIQEIVVGTYLTLSVYELLLFLKNKKIRTQKHGLFQNGGRGGT